MPVQMHGKFFGEVEKMLAAALYEAGQTDREIADAIPTSVNNIISWRRENALTAHPGPVHPADNVPWNASGDIAGSNVPGKRLQRIQPPAPREPQTSAAFDDQTTRTPARPDPMSDGAIEIGSGLGGSKVFVDLEELLTTRLLVQGNSGSGKSHLLRKLLEESTGIVQQIVVDPEGDFVSLGETFGHTVIDAAAHGIGKMSSIARRVRQHRGSAILNLEALDPEQQMDAAAQFLVGLFDAPPEHWFPALVVIDEAQLFAPTSDGGEDPTIRKASLGAMTDLMCRGRKRGLAGVLATQRLAKVHKNVAGEASNFLMGRTFLDIDMARAADLLGLAKRDAEQIRDLNRGEFLGLGPAISRRQIKVKVGSVLTAGRVNSRGLSPLPTLSADEMQGLLLTEEEDLAPARALRVVK